MASGDSFDRKLETKIHQETGERWIGRKCRKSRLIERALDVCHLGVVCVLRPFKRFASNKYLRSILLIDMRLTPLTSRSTSLDAIMLVPLLFCFADCAPRQQSFDLWSFNRYVLVSSYSAERPYEIYKYLIQLSRINFVILC